MAFCNDKASCGHMCQRQDDHGGGCSCYDCEPMRSPTRGMKIMKKSILKKLDPEKMIKHIDSYVITLSNGPVVLSLQRETFNKYVLSFSTGIRNYELTVPELKALMLAIQKVLPLDEGDI